MLDSPRPAKLKSGSEGRSLSAKYRMIDRLIIENFRCFDRLEVDKLASINVVVGENSSGKTALLEAVFFAGAATPESLIRFRIFRGYPEGQLQFSTDRKGYESIWREAFYNFDFGRTIVAKTVGSTGCSRETTVSYSQQGNVPLTVNPDSYSQVPLVFSGVDASGKSFSYRADMTARGINYDATLQMVPIVYFPSSHRPPLREMADRFTSVDVRGELGKLVATLNERFIFLKGLSLGTSGGIPLIYAETTYFREKVPVGVVSNGVEKLLGILLGIATSENGVVLVDELDSSVHYSKIAGVWEALRDFSASYSTQLFVATHSAEWLNGLLPVIRGHEQQFALLRMNVVDNKHIVERFTGEQLRAAIAQNAEIRN
jgi:AAA domain, putative AbiEii toxin, Type IV TA system/AAA ATPase domain